MREHQRRDAGAERAGPGLPDRLAWALLLLSPASLLLAPLPRLAVAALLLAAGWRLRRASRRDGRIAAAGFGLLLALALACLPGPWRLAGGDVARDPESLRSAWTAEWRRLGAAAERAAAVLGAAEGLSEQRSRNFEVLAREAAREPRLHLALLDPDGVAVAWAGSGLVPDLRSRELPETGRAVRTSYGAAALVETRAVRGEGERPWRLVVARPLALDRHGHPAEPLGGRRIGLRPVFPAPGAPLPAGWFAAGGEGLPPVHFDPGRPVVGAALAGAGARCEHALPFVLAITLAAIAVSRGAGRLLLRGTVFATEEGWQLPAALVASAVGAAQVGLGLPPLWLLATAVAAATAIGAARAGGAGGAPRLGVFAAAAVPLLLVALAWIAERAWGPLPVDGSGWLGPTAFAWRAPFAGLAFAALLAAGRGAREGAAGADRWALAALAALGGAALLVDRPALAAVALVAAAAVAGEATSRLRRRRRPFSGWLAIALLAALEAAVAFEIAAVLETRRSLRHDLEGFRPPDESGREALELGIASQLAGLDLAELAPGPGADPIDLPFAIWRGSPLARRDALSGIAVAQPGGRRGIFSWGLPLTSAGELDLDPGRWSAIDLPGWSEALVWGEAEVPAGPEGPLRVRFWLQPRPGFGTVPPPIEDLAAGLLRGGPTLSFDLAGRRGSPRFAFFSPDGLPLVTPWPENPPRLPPLAPGERREGRLTGPDGAQWMVARGEATHAAALFVPLRGVGELLERTGTHVLAVIAWLLLLAGGMALAALPRAAVRDAIRRTVRSYSRRLLVLFTLLVLVPVVLFTLFTTATIARRLEAQQRRGGEAALASAERVLGEYLLTLEPGFGLDTALDDDLLAWLARVVQHQVSLYWSGRVHASSRRELYTAGLLSRQLPGEVEERLVLGGHELVSRDSRAGGVTYLELFAPLRVPGVPLERGRLVLAMPQLAQQEELAAELFRLRRRALLVASALFAGLAALAARLAGGFTRPLAELVESTRRIAAGEPAFARRPEEAELAALVEAVDVMAREIAAGRDRLVREKELVERIVDQVTAGVISLDAGGVVLLANPAARRLLGVEGGEHLATALMARPELAPLVRLLRGGLAPGSRGAIRVPVEGGQDREWSVAWVEVPGRGDAAHLLVVEDDTEVLRGQRLEAWAEMARLIAHEIKNPLTPIRLSTEHLREVWQRDRQRFPEALERCVANILRQVDELREIAGEFASYAGVPTLERTPGDLAAVVREIVDAYGEAPERTARVEMSGPGSLPLRFDSRLLGRALRNLMENALRAAGDGGRVRVELRQREGQIEVAVQDTGPGVAPELLSRIFEPYFSTQAGGTGLGLPIARRIAEGHGGTLAARNLAAGGLEVVLRLPES